METGEKRKNEIETKNATEGQKEIEVKKFQRPTDKNNNKTSIKRQKEVDSD